MRIKPGPVIALALLVGLGGWAYFKEYRGAGKKRQDAEAKERPLRFERADLKAIILRNAGATLRLERQGDDWSLTEPAVGPVDRDALEGLLASIETARIDRRLGTGEDRKAYGLDPAGASVAVLTTAGPEQRVEVGDESPIGGGAYAVLPDTGEIAVVSGTLREAARKDLLSLRDKSLLKFDPWKVNSLTIERGGERVVLSKPEEGWKLETPVEAPADGPTVTELLSALERLRASRFTAERAGDAERRNAGLDKPAARITLREEGWDTAKTIEFGREDQGDRYAQTVGREAIVTVGSDFWSKVTTSVFDLRRKDLLGVSQYRVSMIRAAPADGEPLVLTRQKDGSWLVSGRAQGPVTSEMADGLLRAISDLKAVAFEDKPEESLRASLVRSPALDLVLEQESDTEGGTPRRQHLVIGPPAGDGRLRVRDMAWRPIAITEPRVLTRIRSHMDDVMKAATTPPAAPAAEPTAPGSGTSGAQDTKEPN